MRPRGGSVARRIAVGLAALLLLGITAEQQQPGHSDAVPTGRRPGFEPMDISEEMEQVRTRRARELERQADADTYYRRATPERRMRARYGGPTWNLYEPWH
jgi:hypothetical protein